MRGLTGHNHEKLCVILSFPPFKHARMATHDQKDDVATNRGEKEN